MENVIRRTTRPVTKVVMVKVLVEASTFHFSIQNICAVEVREIHLRDEVALIVKMLEYPSRN